MTSVFEHLWLSGVFGNAEVSARLSANTKLAGMPRIEAAYSGVLGNEAAALAVRGRTGYTTRLDAWRSC